MQAKTPKIPNRQKPQKPPTAKNPKNPAKNPRPTKIPDKQKTPQ
jgi:hypothetical protein